MPMYVIYDYALFDEQFAHTFRVGAITYPTFCFDCNESVWLVPGTGQED